MSANPIIAELRWPKVLSSFLLGEESTRPSQSLRSKSLSSLETYFGQNHLPDREAPLRLVSRSGVLTDPPVSRMVLTAHRGYLSDLPVSRMALTAHQGYISDLLVSRMALTAHQGYISDLLVSRMALTAHRGYISDLPVSRMALTTHHIVIF